MLIAKVSSPGIGVNTPSQIPNLLLLQATLVFVAKEIL